MTTAASIILATGVVIFAVTFLANLARIGEGIHALAHAVDAWRLDELRREAEDAATVTELERRRR